MKRLSWIYVYCCSVLVASFLAGNSTANDIIFPGVEWESTSPESMGVDSQLLADAVSRLPNSSRTMVIRDGRVIWQGNRVDSRYRVWSVTKSFASTAAGLLVDDGLIRPDSKVAEYIPELSERYPELTFEHLLKQSGGIDGNFLSPGQPYFEPGAEFIYNSDADNHALSYGLSVVAGQSFEELIVSRIAEPLGMNVDNITFEQLVLRSGDKVAEFQRANHGLQIAATDLARYGLLYMNGGVWDGERLLSHEWIDAATQVQVKDVPNNPASLSNSVGEYGYGWWNLDHGGQFNAFGFDNNHLLVDPVSGFVVASVGAGGSQAPFVAGLENAELPYVWPHGAGNWHDVDVATGNSRWTFNGEASNGLPRGKAILRGGTVELDQHLRSRTISIENQSTLRVLEPAELIARSIAVDERSQLEVHGALLLTSLDVDGSAELTATANVVTDATSIDGGTLNVAGAAELGLLSLRGAAMIIDGPVTFQSGFLRDSTIQILNGDSDVHIAGSFRPAGSTKLSIVVDGDAWERTVRFDERSRARLDNAVLEIKLDPAMDPHALAGTSLDLFEWGRSTTEFESISVPSRLQLDVSALPETGQIDIVSVLSSPTTAGDFNGDDLLDAVDLDELLARVHIASTDLYYDVDGDGEISISDRENWLEEFRGTTVGDIDLNGEVDFADFLSLSANYGTQGGWQQGDFDGDQWVLFSDFLLLSENYGREETVAVPEPCDWPLLLFAASGLHMRRKRARSI